MDMQMPELDGYSATAKLRSLGYLGPIIALTANAMAADRDKCIQAGCTDYLSKPVSRPLLLEAVRRHLLGSTASGPAESDGSPTSSQENELPLDGSRGAILTPRPHEGQAA
jgi:DNA-binding response OmpR family regulator